MENLLADNFNSLNEIISYFSVELFYIIGIIVNVIMYLFFKKTTALKRVSDLITSGVFLINILVLSGIYIKNCIAFGGFNSVMFNNSMYLSSQGVILNIFVNLFMFAFILITYKLTRKTRYKLPIVNAALLVVAMCAGLLIKTNNFLLTYLLLDALTIFIYKYGSLMRIRKYNTFSSGYILLGLISSALFYVFYIMTFIFSKNMVQLDIVRVCMTLAIFLKIGLFPVYNYVSTREYKLNIPYSILLFTFLPWMGVVAFNKLAESFNTTNEIYQIPVLIFICASVISFCLFAAKQKNIIKFNANLAYLVNIFCIMYIIYFANQDYKPIELSCGCAFILMAFWSLICVLKINLKLNKVNIASFKGLFVNNRIFAFLCTLVLLMAVFVLPTYNSTNFISMLKNIYVYDKTGLYIIYAVLFAFAVILFRVFKLIKNIYLFEKNSIKDKFTTRTTQNYVVLAMIIIVLISGMFL